MSFQHFRVADLALPQPLPPHLAQNQVSANPSTSTFATQTQDGGHASNKSPSSAKQPYGSGDSDDGYTLVFPNLEAFHDWRNQEEERQMVEFGDTHGSKAVPPRFKDHTKLVCARHSRSGRKKYVKKHPERVRKVPSRKLEGIGCPASISFKTYYETDEVRACYVSQHSHEIGLANLPFTRRGRKAAAQRDKDRTGKDGSSPDTTATAPTISTDVNHMAGTNGNAVAGPSSAGQPSNAFGSAVSMLAPLPGQGAYSHPPQTYSYAPPPQSFAPLPAHPPMSHDRWENMATLFNSIREHARGFEYPSVSVAALETVLIRLYLESPVGLGTQPVHMQNGIVHQRPPPVATTQAQNVQHARPTDSSAPEGVSGTGMEEGG